MPVKYALHPNKLTGNPNDYRGIIQHSGSYNVEDVIDDMVHRGSTVTRAEALAVIEEYESAIIRLITEGGRINTPLFRIGLSLSGIFDGDEDQFDPKRHELNLNFSAGKRVRAVGEEIELEKSRTFLRRPVLQTFVDATTDTVNEMITPGGICKLRGRHLKTDPADAQQGVFFSGTGGSDVRVDRLIRNKPKELIFIIPETLPTSCDVEVRTNIRYTTGIRTGRLQTSLQRNDA